ncbi:MAG: FAS1-like dehydratase domain-containing protein [Dehalococcoidia bacterium]
METEPLITDAARALIGHETETYLGEISLRDCQRYAIAVGDLNPLYFDEAYARQSAYGGLIAPPNMLTAVRVFDAGVSEAELAADGIPNLPEEKLPVRLQRRMAGGQDLRYHAPVRPGDRITKRGGIVSLDEREGKSGVFLVMLRVDRYYNERGELLVTCRETVLIR